MGAFSFAAGAGTLPPEVRADLSHAVADWHESGFSALELPFTTPAFRDVLESAEDDLRTLLEVPASYRVLFLQGGASAHFALVPLNLSESEDCCDYAESGYWSRRAIEEARSWCRVNVLATADGLRLPDCWKRSARAAYCHFTSNETADGLQFRTFPDPGGVPLVCDMTGDFLMRPIPVTRFGLIYASAQKTLGAAGLTVVIVHEDLLGHARRGTPAPFDYTRQANARSTVNTPPTFSVVVAQRMLTWIVANGGLAGIEARSRRNSDALYAAIDDSGFYHCPVARRDRSRVSICFRTPTPALDDLFVEEAAAAGLLHLKGHPRVGGLRASLYNAVSAKAVHTLIDFMADFRHRRG